MDLGSQENDAFVRVGRVKSAHGLKGEIFISLFAGEAAWLDNLEQVRLVAPQLELSRSRGKGRPREVGYSTNGVMKKDERGSKQSADALAPANKVFAIGSLRLHKNGLIVLSPDIRGRDAAESLRGWLLEIPRSFLVSSPGDQPYLAEIEGFQVHVKGRGEVGKITGFSSNGVQDLLVIQCGELDYEVPFVGPFVEEIDYKAKCLCLDLPIGLLGETLAD